MTKKRQARGSSAKTTPAKSSASSGDTTRRSTRQASSKSAENVARLVFDELELHKIAYLSARGWVPSRLNPETGRYGWGIDYDDDSGREAWYMDINDAYEYQQECDKEDRQNARHQRS